MCCSFKKAVTERKNSRGVGLSRLKRTGQKEGHGNREREREPMASDAEEKGREETGFRRGMKTCPQRRAITGGVCSEDSEILVSFF